MKFIIERVIQLRNPAFKLDSALNTLALIQFVFDNAWSMFRALKVLFFFKPPKAAMFGKGVRFFNISKIHWGGFLKLGDYVYMSALGKKGITIGNNVGIGSYSRLVVSTTMNNLGEFITIGNNVGIGEFAYLGGAGGLEIGDDCIIGQYLSCHPENHMHDELEVAIRLQGVTRKGIRIGKNCWIGSKVTILDGVEIAQGCIVAAGSVVNKSFPANSIIGGVPAKLIRNRDNDK